MPYVNLKVVGKLTKEQKNQIAKEFSDTLLRVANKPKAATYLVIDEVSGENWAQGTNQTASAQTAPAAVAVNNTVCPVTGEKIDPASKVTYEYQGKIYNFCCSVCIGDFKKDPQKYLKKLAPEKQ